MNHSISKYRQFIDQITTGKPVKEYIDYERDVTDTIMEVLECDNGDAQGVMEASSYDVMSGYNDGLTSDEVAHIIVNKRFTL
jgi:hypothetical protein